MYEKLYMTYFTKNNIKIKINLTTKNFFNDLKIYKIKSGRIYTDFVSNVAIIENNKIP